MNSLKIFFLVVMAARAFPLTHARRFSKQKELQRDLSDLLEAAQQGELLHFTLDQTVLTPILPSRNRLPECLPPRNISELLTQHINSTYGAMITGNFKVDTTYVQGMPDVQHCMYSSYIFYTGDQALKRFLVAAANVGAGKICGALPGYCKEAFNKASGYVLKACSGNLHPKLPPQLDFHCVKHNFTQKLDHFNSAEERTFQQVYWVCDTAWPKEKRQQVKEQSGHIIVFLGNESPLGTPSQPIVFEHAQKLNALVVEVEHRYYGDSQPFPEALQDDGMLNSTAMYKWLAVEQVIEDTAAVLKAVRKTHQVPKAVPAIVIGGSYGGMLAAYHRVSKPGVFAAAIAASAPVSFMFKTPEWKHTSNRYHKIVAASVKHNSQHSSCLKTIRKGFEMFEPLSETSEGRQKLAKVFNLCGDAAIVLPDVRSAFALEMEQYDWFEGFVQVNNQPSLLGQMKLACDVITDVMAESNDELAALAAATTYFASNGSDGWCYDFNATFYLTDRSTYAYQGCTQGFPNTAVLPDKGHKHDSLVPAFKVHTSDYTAQCQGIFGPDSPALQVPSVAATLKHLVRKHGGVVFTNGELDGWAGGSYMSYEDIWEPTAAGELPGLSDSTLAGQEERTSYAAGDQRLKERPNQGAEAVQFAQWRKRLLLSKGRETADLQEHMKAGSSSAPVAFVTYKHASHCTDTHNIAWNNPAVAPKEWKRQRARAVGYAMDIAEMFRKHALSSTAK